MAIFNILTESFAFPPEPPWNGFQILRQQLPRLSYHARMLSPSGRSGVKSSRDLFWGDASRLYRKTTGKRQTVSVGSETSDRPGVPYGPFVDFIQAITIAAGEPEPTPEQIRALDCPPARFTVRSTNGQKTAKNKLNLPIYAGHLKPATSSIVDACHNMEERCHRMKCCYRPAMSAVGTTSVRGRSVAGKRTTS
jgi:hypothetical protein